MFEKLVGPAAENSCRFFELSKTIGPAMVPRHSSVAQEADTFTLTNSGR